MLAHPLPFESIWSSTVLTKVAFGFINYLLQHTDTLLHIALRVPSVDSAISKLVRTLLSQRYWEDINKYAVCTSDYCDGQKEVSHCSLLHELQPLDSSSHDLDSKVSSYAEQVASVAVKGLVDSVLADMSYTLQYDGKETNDEGDLVILQQYIIRTYGIRLDTEDDDEDYIAMSRNQVKNIEAVLSMKLCDYIEEVFYTITSLLHPERTHSDKVCMYYTSTILLCRYIFFFLHFLPFM
ncbi:hypothetical protein EON65_35495 [archaeon]|nr:MAG: hypothetical protein EON65_35495 [archaeon]